MRYDISHITLPDDFNKVTDFYIPDESPMYGIMYPGPLQIILNREYGDVVNFMVTEARKSTKLEFSLELIHEGSRVIFRGHSIQSIEGKVFIFRHRHNISFHFNQ